MQLSRLVLPAPLGPIRPVMEPSATSRLTLSSARSPPKERPSPWTTRNSAMGALHANPGASGTAPGAQAPQQLRQPTREQEEHDDDDRAVERLREPGLILQHLQESRQEERTGDGAQRAVQAADHDHRHKADRQGQIEAVRSDVAGPVGIQRAGNTGVKGAEREGGDAVARQIDA